MKILHVDSRQKKYHKEFGDIQSAPAERLFTYTDIVEPIGSVACVSISDVKVAGSQTGQTYDYNDLFNNSPHNVNGANPSDVFGTIVKRGLLRFGSVIRDAIWKSYWSVTSDGAGDAFDNTINASNHANSAVTVWTNFYPNWVTLLPLEVMPQGVGTPSDHDWVVKGWQMVNGVQMMVIDWHGGQVNLMPREVFNLEVSRLGCGTGIPVTTAIQAVERRTIIQYLIDLYQNLLLIVESQNGGFPPPSNPATTVQNFCNAIAMYEGGAGDLNHINNNPGNCVYNIDGYLPKYGDVKQHGRFAVFPTWDLGMLYLQNLTKQHIFAHPTWTIFDFFAEFFAPMSDGNNPLAYSQFVAKHVGLTTGDTISKLT